MSFCPPAPHRLPSAEPLFQGTLPCHQPAGRRKFKNKKKKQKDPKNTASQAAVDASSLRGSLVNSTTTASYAVEIWGQAPGEGGDSLLPFPTSPSSSTSRSGDPRGGQHSPQPINILADSICLYTGSFILPVCLSRISVRAFPYGSLPCSAAWQAFRAVAPVWAEGTPCARFQTYRARSSRQHPYRAVLDGQKSFPRY